MSNCAYQLCQSFDVEKSKVSAVGSIVVNTNEVSFHAFRANSSNVMSMYKVPIANVSTLREGWAEQDAIAILSAVHKCINYTVIEGKVSDLTVVAVGISNHRGSVVAWNKSTGVPLCNVILWSDNRTAIMIDKYLKTNDKYRFQTICGLPFSPYFSAFKIKWLIDNDATVKAALKQENCYFGTIDSWLLWNLTGGVKDGVFATDTSNASNTFLMNINTLEWDKKLLKFFDIPLNSLPIIKTSSGVYGKFDSGPLIDTPISSMMGDRQAAIVGHRCFRTGLTKIILDDSGSIFTITGENKVFSENGLLTTIGYQLDKRPVFALEGPIASAGKSIEWVSKCFNIDVDKCELSADKTHEKHELQNIIYFVPAFNGLYAPHWRPDARCVFIVGNGENNKEDILKAAIESTCFQAQDILEALNKDLRITIDKIKVDGELSENAFMMRFLSDITNTKVEVARFKYMTALGTAMAAGFATEINVWDALCMPEDCGSSFTPKTTFDGRKKRIFDWKRAMGRSYDWVEYKHSLNHYWLTIPIIGVVLLGGYLILK